MCKVMKKYSVFQIVRFKNYIAVHLSVFVFANFTIPNHLWLRFRFVNRAAYDNILSALKYYGSTNLSISLVLMCINTQTSVQHACLMAKTIQFPPFNTPQIHLDFIAMVLTAGLQYVTKQMAFCIFAHSRMRNRRIRIYVCQPHTHKYTFEFPNRHFQTGKQRVWLLTFF